MVVLTKRLVRITLICFPPFSSALTLNRSCSYNLRNLRNLRKIRSSQTLTIIRKFDTMHWRRPFLGSNVY